MKNARYKHLARYWKGKDNPMYGKHLSEEHKKKISLKLIGRKLSKKHRERIRIAQKGKAGKRNANWKGGRIKDEKGYVHVYCPFHPYATKKGYVMEHRLVMEKRLGRVLLPTEVSHHINEVSNDNRDSNLKFFPNRGSHTRHHLKGKSKGDKQNVKTT